MPGRIAESFNAQRTGALAMMLKTTNGPLYFETVGSGPPLVFLSGWAMTCECWRPVVALLSKRYCCLLYDGRGVGRSQPVAADASFGMEEHAEDLQRLPEAAGIYDAGITTRD